MTSISIGVLNYLRLISLFGIFICSLKACGDFVSDTHIMLKGPNSLYICCEFTCVYVVNKYYENNRFFTLLLKHVKLLEFFACVK